MTTWALRGGCGGGDVAGCEDEEGTSTAKQLGTSVRPLGAAAGGFVWRAECD